MRVTGRALCLATFAILAPALAFAGAAATPPEESLNRIINRELRAGGPFFTAPERALVERKCGDAPGTWDGFQVNINNGVLTCANGRRVDDPELRALLRAAEPRISRRVEAVMDRPVVTAAIARVAAEAEERALREVRARHGD
ncbi:MAG TPA: hypothetical protein VMG08_02385 [Allosphingosinicella sp.]|nr:hypothetical protein [Allosphingosinicella sp.]